MEQRRAGQDVFLFFGGGGTNILCRHKGNKLIRVSRRMADYTRRNEGKFEGLGLRILNRGPPS
jgi:hypothetical protein